MLGCCGCGFGCRILPSAELASSCCENGLEFGQIDDRWWFAWTIRAVGDDRRKNREQQFYVSPVHRVALIFLAERYRSGVG